MAVISGQRFTTHQSTETRNVRDVKSKINELEPDKYPLVAIMNKAAGKLLVAGQKKVEWFENSLLPRYDVLGADLTAGAATMTVTNYAYFRKGDLVRVNRSEHVFVSATPTTTTVSIRRAYGTVAAAAATSGDQLHIISNVSDEGDTLGDVLTMQKVPMYNYCANIKNPVKISATAQASDVYGPDDLSYEKGKAIIEHAKSIENLNIMGQRKLDQTNETNLAVYNGCLVYIATNIKDAGGTFTEDEMEDVVRRAFRYGSKNKVLFASSKLCTVLNGFGREKLAPATVNGSYGVTMSEYVNAGKKLMIIEHPLLENDSLTDLTGLAGTGIILDIADMSFRHMKGRYMKMDECKPMGDSTMSDFHTLQILTEGCLQLEQEKKHAVITGVTD